MNDTISLYDGLKDAFVWYKYNSDKVNPKTYLNYIDNNFRHDV